MLESCVFVLEKDRKRKEEGRLEILFLEITFLWAGDHAHKNVIIGFSFPFWNCEWVSNG